MKIVFLTRHFPPTICGVGDHTYHLAQQMQQQGLKVSIICFSDQKPVELDGIDVFPIVKRWNRGGVLAVVNKVKMLQPDWFISQYVPHGFQSKGLPLASLLLYRQLNQLNVPILTIFHEVKIRPENALKTQIYSFIQAKIADSLAEKSTKIVTSIDFYADYLKRFADKITVLPIASNILPIDVSEDVKQQLRNKYGISKATKVVCTFGDRDITHYLPAFDRLTNDYPNFVWLLCGKNSTPSVIIGSRPYIRYVGKMSAENIYQHLSLGDVFFMPDDINADGEGGTSNKSGSLATAFSLGIPIVATKGDLNNALLVDGQNILLTDIRHQTALYEALKSCFDSPTLALKLGNNARQLHDKTLTWERSAAQLLESMGVKFREFEKKYTPSV